MSFPYKAWMVQPAGKAVEVTVVDRSFSSSLWHVTDTDKYVDTRKLYKSREEALRAELPEIQKAYKKLERDTVNLRLRKNRLDKKRALVESQLADVDPPLT